jgi:hypothetical protein
LICHKQTNKQTTTAGACTHIAWPQKCLISPSAPAGDVCARAALANGGPHKAVLFILFVCLSVCFSQESFGKFREYHQQYLRARACLCIRACTCAAIPNKINPQPTNQPTNQPNTAHRCCWISRVQRPSAIRCSTSSTVLAHEAVSTRGASSVTRTSSSMRMPMPRNRAGMSGESGMYL